MKRANMVKFVYKCLKQILFALFLFIINKYLSKDVLCMAAPVIVSAGVKKVAASTAKTAAINGAKIGAVSGAVNASNNDENMVSGAANGAVNGAVQGATSSFLGNKLKSKNNDGLTKTKNLENSSISSSTISNENNNIFSGLSGLTSKIKGSSKGLFSTNKEESSITPNKKTFVIPLMFFGCLPTLIIGIFVLALPLLFVSYVSPISDVVSGLSNISETETKNDTGLSTFIEKARNFFSFGSFDTNENVLSTKVDKIYDKIAKEYDVAIDVPLLLATLFSDISSSNKDEIEVNTIMLERLEYAYDVAKLQINEGYVVYKCLSKKVNNEIVVYKEISKETDNNKAEVGVCNTSNVGKLVKEKTNVVGESEEYYINLKEEKSLLKKIYGSDNLKTDEDYENLIEEIKNSKNVFNIIYTESEDDTEAAGNLPSSLLLDEKINFSSPLKGNYSMTSAFGNRTGIFSGMHKGIDMISNDTTIYAAGNGVVTSVYTESSGGNVIEITHTDSSGEQYISLYAHLSKFLVAKGETVKSGDAIGIMGDTGIVSGVHLHFQVWKVSPYTLYNPKNVFTKLK